MGFIDEKSPRLRRFLILDSRSGGRLVLETFDLGAVAGELLEGLCEVRESRR